MIQQARTPLYIASAAPAELNGFHAPRQESTLHRPIPSPEPNPEPNPGPDSVSGNGQSGISPADWDQLFCAVQLRLEQCVGNSFYETSALAPQDWHKAVQTTVLECVEAMQQLHAALKVTRELSHRYQLYEPHQPSHPSWPG